MSLAHYLAQSPYSSPGDRAHLYADLPADPARLARMVRDLLIHRCEGPLFAYEIPSPRLHDDAETRYVDGILEILAARSTAPLDKPRAPADRFVGVCRDFALLHCSFLRHTGTPARIRSGFADYFGTDGFHCDHVVTEYWDARTERWLLADPQLADPAVTRHWNAGFDPMDVPRTRFLTAGRAWRMIREQAADPRTFGLHPPHEGPLWGERFVAGNVRLDLAALNRTETLLWDVWGADHTEYDQEQTLDDAARAVYDRAAALLAGDEVPFAEVRALFAGDDVLRTPERVLSLAPYNGPGYVTLRS
ncbi:transglutaminase domain-containing protein [Streptomyces roseirectus]|uniref:Transglutaminase domain-containing protein n=1 Tax=Streptomyces roseirectus TaxID=2768066 RepID=A0A7H0IDR3_9ACTN|nr:transglutaminase-like domain-containing protein [Streptomyces roseirectus]QNP70929.1 transglutaminase domain-containing protein [Streptomyces roseirectus]